MFGLIVSDPSRALQHREALTRLLHDYDLPLTGFTEAPASLFTGAESHAAFLRTASAALLQPGQPLPIEVLEAFLPTGPLTGNVLRHYLFLQQSLMPYLRPGRSVTPMEGGFLLGDDLLVARVSAEDTVDVILPGGIWTELNGVCHRNRLRCLRGYNEMPVLARENALLPISMNGQSLTQTASEDADRLTLHWFQPGESAQCVLADGTVYRVRRTGAGLAIDTDARFPFHLIVHEDGAEQLIR